MRNYYIREYERLLHVRLPACSKAKGERVDMTLSCLNMEGFSLSSLNSKTINFVKIAISLGQNYYPEIMSEMFIIRCPLVFRAAYKMFKPFINEATRKKIHIRGGSFKDLFEKIDPDQVPTFMGGTSEAEEIGPWLEYEGDEFGQEMMRVGALKEKGEWPEEEAKQEAPTEEKVEEAPAEKSEETDPAPAAADPPASEAPAPEPVAESAATEFEKVESEAKALEAEAEAVQEELKKSEEQFAEIEAQLKELPVGPPEEEQKAAGPADLTQLASKLEGLAVDRAGSPEFRDEPDTSPKVQVDQVPVSGPPCNTRMSDDEEGDELQFESGFNADAVKQ